MKLIYCILLFFFASHLKAQEIDKVQLRIHYATKFKRWENSKNMSSDEQVLDIGKKVSKFYSLWETRNEEVRDNILAVVEHIRKCRTYQEKLAIRVVMSIMQYIRTIQRKGESPIPIRNLKIICIRRI